MEEYRFTGKRLYLYAKTFRYICKKVKYFFKCLS